MVMKEYDVVVIGSGAGSLIVDQALAHGLKVALVDHGPLGGTCLNVGCIPSKMLVFPADRVVEIQEAGRLGIQAEVRDIDFRGIMERTRTFVRQSREHISEGIRRTQGLDCYEATGRFVGDYTMEVGGQRIRGKRFFIASGARARIPALKGLRESDYLDNVSVFELTERPETLIIIGGGYIAVEFAHFFAAMGTRVTILQRGERLVKDEEPEVSRLLQKRLEKRMDIHVNTEALEVAPEDGGFSVTAKDHRTGETRVFGSEKILIAAGRVPNSDLLDPEKTGVGLN
ncbi:MAG: FAD-dependent oxidoreductase, partial [Candidatus Aminicenantales bacterium]